MCSPIYRVVLFRRSRDSDTVAPVQSPFASKDRRDAEVFAQAFNRREAVDPVGLWAVVREAQADLAPTPH